MRILKGWGCVVLLAFALPGMVFAQAVKLGSGSYFLAPKASDKGMPAAPGRTEAMLKQAAPTNQWYSNLIFSAVPEALYALPLTVKPTPAGLEVALPSKEVVPTERHDVEIHYVHRDALVVSPAAFEPGPAKLAKVGDWSIDILMARGADELRATVAHGSPYVQMRISRGDVRLRLPAAGERLPNADARVLALQVKGKPYALFGPTGVVWEPVSATEWLGRMPAGKGYLSVAALPDGKAETLTLFARHAYAFLDDTRVAWRYDAASSRVETTFTATTKTMEGGDNGPLLGLYPHQWFNNASVEGRLGDRKASCRERVSSPV